MPPVVDHGHNVGEVQTFHHHLHEILISASTGHKLIQGKLACWRGKSVFNDTKVCRVSNEVRFKGVLLRMTLSVSRGQFKDSEMEKFFFSLVVNLFFIKYVSN